MLKNFLSLLDFFLPEHIGEQMDMARVSRARFLVASSLLGIGIGALLFIGTTIFSVPLFIRIGILCSILVFSMLVVFLKTRATAFTISIDIAAFIQILVVTLIVYLNAFLINGLGFFSLIWLIPMFLMIAFYFRPLHGLVIILFNVIMLGLLIYFYHDKFFHPIDTIPTFKGLYLLYLGLVFLACYLLALVNVQLNIHLQEEIGKQKNLLVESAKFHSLGQMASNLAHDINNPLFTIQGKLHQIRNLFSHDELDLEKCDQIIEEVESTILRLSQIVKGISTFARQGRADQMVSVSADELIRGLVLIASDRIVQSGITFDLKVAPGTRVICYPSYISQVLINLLNNAIDALDNSEVKIIQIEAFATDKWVEIHIKDSGPGVPPEIESKIFEAFFTTKKFGKGTGLGLSISKGLIETHEGQLEYKRIDRMTDFTVYLPTYE